MQINGTPVPFNTSDANTPIPVEKVIAALAFYITFAFSKKEPFTQENEKPKELNRNVVPYRPAVLH